MAHIQQIEFCQIVKLVLPEFFKGRNVLDIGSLDINGNNRSLFEYCKYTGIDLAEGPNVDEVCRGHLYKGQFDVVVSTECFEHDEYYKETIKNIVHNLLVPGGLFFFTCATTGRPEHGTTAVNPAESPFTGAYYKNLTEKDFREILDFDKEFSSYRFDVLGYDIYFWGLKCKK